MQRVGMVKEILAEAWYFWKQIWYVLFVDNESVLYLGKDPTFHNSSMHFNVRYHWIHDVLDAKLLELAEVHIEDNGFDMMVKALPRGKFEIFCDIAGLVISPIRLWGGHLLGIGLPSYVEKIPNMLAHYVWLI
jgi:hypothetical protein